MGRGACAEISRVDDAAAPGRLALHQPNRALRAEEGPGQIGVDDRLPVRVGQVLHGNAGSVRAGVVEQRDRAGRTPFRRRRTARRPHRGRRRRSYGRSFGGPSPRSRAPRRRSDRASAASATFRPARAAPMRTPSDPKTAAGNQREFVRAHVSSVVHWNSAIAAQPRARQSRRSPQLRRQPPDRRRENEGAADQRRKIGRLAKGEQHPERSHHDIKHRDQRRLSRRHVFGASMNKAKAIAMSYAEREQHRDFKGADGTWSRPNSRNPPRQRRQRVDRGDRQSGIAPLQDHQQRERHGHASGRATGRAGARFPAARGHDDDPDHREARGDQRSPRGALPRDRERHARREEGQRRIDHSTSATSSSSTPRHRPRSRGRERDDERRERAQHRGRPGAEPPSRYARASPQARPNGAADSTVPKSRCGISRTNRPARLHRSVAASTRKARAAAWRPDWANAAPVFPRGAPLAGRRTMLHQKAVMRMTIAGAVPDRVRREAAPLAARRGGKTRGRRPNRYTLLFSRYFCDFRILSCLTSDSPKDAQCRA